MAAYRNARGLPPLEPLIRYDHANTATCAAALAGALGAAVVDALKSKPRASLALSGGRSPEAVLPLLAAAPVDWSRVDVTLVDDRRVPSNDAASNAGLVDRFFLQRGAGAAAFYPLWTGTLPLAEALEDTERRLSKLLPVDVAYLGMGPDGHVASLFPAESPAAFDIDGATVIATEAPSAPHGRVSLTFSEIANIGKIFLHVTGAAKIRVLEQSMRDGTTPGLPVSLLLKARPDIDAFVCE